MECSTYGTNQLWFSSNSQGKSAKLIDRRLCLRLVGVAFFAICLPISIIAISNFMSVSFASPLTELERKKDPPTVRLYFGNASSLYMAQVVDGKALDAFQFSCNQYDDDEYYPLKPGGNENDPTQDCETQDSLHWCEACKRSEACQQYCGLATADCDGGQGDFQFVQPCMWQLVANLPDTCAGIFTAYAPLSSKNIDPKQDLKAVLRASSHWQSNADGTVAWGCALHALCNACADLSQPSSLNLNCLSIILYYLDKGIEPDNLAIFEHFDEFTDYWCQDNVLEDILDGTFASKFSIPEASPSR